MSQSFSQSFSCPKLLLGVGFLVASAQAQINFFPATEEACNELNFPCQGGILCCPRPYLCIPYLNQLSCLDIGGSPMDSGTGDTSLDDLLGDILGGDEISLPPVISDGEVGPAVLPTIPSDGGEIAFTPSVSGDGIGPIVFPTTINDGGIPFTPSFPDGEVTPIVIPTPPPVRPGGNDESLGRGDTVTPSPTPSTTTESPSTSTGTIASPTIPTGGEVKDDNNAFVTPST